MYGLKVVQLKPLIMQSTKTFKSIISDHLQSLALNDPLFAETLKKANKNINDCSNYILGQVQKSGNNGFADEEIFAMAVHYYDEDDIKDIKPVQAMVVVNQTLEKFKQVVENRVHEAPKPIKKANKQVIANQSSLF